MMRGLRPRLLVLALIVPAASFAQETPAPAAAQPSTTAATPARTWTFDAKVSYASTSGNSDTANGAAELDYVLKGTRWELNASASALRAESDGATNAETYDAGAVARRRLDERLGLVLSEQWYRAPLAGISYRNLLAAGVDFRLVERTNWQLLAELGLGWQHEETTAGASSDDAVGIAVLASKMRLSPTTTATLKLTNYFEGGIEDQRFEAEAALQAALTRRLSLQVSYDLRYDERPVDDAETTDTVLQTSLVFHLGSAAASGSN